MNDTFDNFASQLDNLTQNLLNSTKNILSTVEKSSENSVNNISLDDSIFLDDQKSEDPIDVNNKCTYKNESTTYWKNNTKSPDLIHSKKLDHIDGNFVICDSRQDIKKSDDSTQKRMSDLPKLENSLEDKDNKIQAKITDNSILPLNQSSLTSNHLLSSWGIPEMVLKSYQKRKITSMFNWQLECLSANRLMEENKNLVYSAPTSAGKTLVAEILAMKCLFERKKKVIFILPFISVVREKMYYFQDLLTSSGKRVEGFMGSHNPPGGFQPVHMAVGTIEKCNSLVNRLLEENKLEDIGMVIIDEMHLIGDPHRGYLLELLLTKLKYIMHQNEKVRIQIVGMSATLPNLDVLAKWLDAELYTTNFRPIPLHEMVYVSKEVYNNEFKLLRRLPTLPELTADTDDILQLCLETIECSCSVLVFCPTKNWCENLAQQIAMAFYRIGKTDCKLSKVLRENLNLEKITEILEQLKLCPSGLDKTLKKTVAFGVAFHHAGLTMEERDIIEGGFRNGGIKLLIATSTLSSGVNLPARRVIIRSPLFNGKPLDILTYRQMIGRAGRMGIDSEGQSILICQKSDHNVAKNLTQSSLKPVQSCLLDVVKFKRAVLEIIASGVASSPDDLDIFEKSTLVSIQNSESIEKDPVKQVVEFLVKFNFIRLQNGGDGSSKYVPTPLGKACLSSSLPPGEGLELFTELEKARQCLVLETDLHLVYLVTPYSVCYQWSNIDWMFYLDLWEKLSLSMKKVGELVGVRESFIINATRGNIPDSPKLFVHKRFFVALALQDLVNEKSLDEVAAKFNCNRGMLQSLQQSASSFAGMVTSFSRQLGWSSFEILISQFQDRLQFGINRDLLDLMRLPCLNSKQARALFNGGIGTLVELANSNVSTIENILHKVVPFENIRERENETEHDFKQRSRLRTIWITGRQGLTEEEAAKLILDDARVYLEQEMGINNANWGVSDEEMNNNKTTDVKENANIKQSEDVKTDCHIISNSTKSIEMINSVAENHARKIAFNGSPIKISNTLKNISEKHIEVEPTSNTIESTISKKYHLPKNPDSKSTFDKLATSNANNSFKTCEKKIQSSTSFRNNKGYNKENLSANQNTSSPKKDLMLEMKKFEDLRIESPSTSTKKNVSYSTLNTPNNSRKRLYQSSVPSTLSDNSSLGSHSDDDLFHESLEETIDKVSFLTVESKRLCYPNISPAIKKQKMLQDDEIESITKDPNFMKTIDLSEIFVIEVCKTEKLFEQFSRELLTVPRIASSLSCSCVEEVKTRIGINEPTLEDNENLFHYQGKKINGLALTWDGKHVFYIHLENKSRRRELGILKTFFVKRYVVKQIFDSKDFVVMLNKALNINVEPKIEDPKILEWILDPDVKEKNLHSMISRYCPEALALSSFLENYGNKESSEIKTSIAIEPKTKAAIETVLTWSLMSVMKDTLNDDLKNFSSFDVEMEAVLSISKMEASGIGVDLSKMESLISIIKSNCQFIERRIFQLAGRKFSLMSSKEVAKVIGLSSTRKISTSKQILERSTSPVASLILLWRKLSCTLTKMLQPLLAAAKNGRIYGKCILRTSTGRISMHEPNVQNVAKDFDFINPITNTKVTISCRSIFVPKKGHVFLSADFCQLEFRMLAHLSKDATLCRILNSEGDIFKTIAARWNDISEEEVTDVLRSQTKQICYGIIYGIGSKALAEQMKINPEEATRFMENFKDTYPGIKSFIQNTLDNCKLNGSIETLAGRKRYLSLINDQNPAIRSHAERQAINSTIQGSAADLVKKAMMGVEESFRSLERKPSLVLHLHDELLYEVEEKYLGKTAALLKNSMETSSSLTVIFPVKLKVGDSWGSLNEYCNLLE